MTDTYLMTTPGPLLNEDGSLAQMGWARQPLLDPNIEKLAFYRLRFLQPLRIKRWDYYGITTPTHFFSFTLGDVGYLGQVFAYVIDFATGKYHEATLSLPFGGGVSLPRFSDEGVGHFSNKKVSMRFELAPLSRHLLVSWKDFGGVDLKADVTLEVPAGQESMVNVFPMGGRRFFYTRKINCLPASGQVILGSQAFPLDPQTCFGNQDWGCGVWPYKSFWIWANASSRLPDGRRLGLNLGGGISTLPGINDNALLLDGRVHKLGIVDYQYSTANFMQPWQMASRDGRLQLTFTPFFERVAKTDLKVFSSEVHQLFGRFHGRVTSDEGEVLPVENIVGWAEEHHARW